MSKHSKGTGNIMTPHPCRIFRSASAASRTIRTTAIALTLGWFVLSAGAATLIYQEGFNTDGETNTPPRYTTTGRDIYEVPRIQAELANFDQKGPIYWAHNFNVSYVGNPNIPARRMIFTWRSDPAGGAASSDLLQLFDSSVNWLLNGKANATIVVNPNAASINELAARLTAAGHTVVDDDLAGVPDEQDVQGDLFIHGPGAGNPSRFAMVPKPVMVMNEPDYDDMLVGSIGALATFDPGQVTIAAPAHPAAGGKTGSFTGFNVPAQPFGLVGSFLPPGATTVATVTRVIPPAVNNLGDVDAMIAGTKQHDKTTNNTITDIDFSDASSGNWFIDNTIPGGYAGNWGLRIQGKITVSTPGTYRFAVGSDDGARLQIDRDRNGFTSTDTILEDPGPHGHQIVYADASFGAAGDYDFEVRSYNSGGGGSLEVSVANVPVPVPDDALDSGYWEVLSQTGASAVRLQSAATVTGYLATGANVQVQVPLIVALNGPTDTPPGSFYDGGQFSGFEGTGFLGAAGLNKWAYPANQNYRSVTLRSVNVAGRTNVKLTVALAGTVVDFEDSDFIDILVYTNGPASTPTTLAHFRGVQNAIQPWLADQRDNFVRRLTRQFADFTYDIPAGATDLIVEFRVATTWWTEIAAIDNVRITEGAITAVPQIANIGKTGNSVTITWINGGTLEWTAALAGATTQWTSTGDTDGSYTETVAGTKYFRVRQ
jgi:PA14 domain-containing protein